MTSIIISSFQSVTIISPYLIVAFLGLVLLSTYAVLKKTCSSSKSYSKNSHELELETKQVQKTILFIGIITPIIEVFSFLFNLNQAGLKISNLILGVVLVMLYIISIKNKFLENNIRITFSTLIVIYTSFLFFKLYLAQKQELGVLLNFFVIFLVSKNVYKSNTKYALFNIFVQFSLSVLYLNSKISLELFFALSCGLLIITVINHLRQATFYNTRDKYLFTSEIVNNSNNLTIATNRAGEVIFCSKNIINILGYESHEVMGLAFWKLTQDAEFKGEAYHENYKDNRTYVRRLKNKLGEIRLIEWNDKMYHNNLFVGIGTDITYQNKIESQYKELVEKATDLIYEIDTTGHFTFVNNYFLELLEYNIEDIKHIHFLSIIEKEYHERVKKFYSRENLANNEFPILEFSVRTKSGKRIWASQKVTLKRDLNYKVIGYSTIARDITNLKELEISKKTNEQKSERYNQTLIKLAKFHFEIDLNNKKFIEEIILESSKALQIDRISYWEFTEDSLVCFGILCNNHYNTEDKTSIKLDSITKYLAIIMQDGICSEDDITKASFYDEFKAYKEAYNIKSMLDMSIIVNNIKHGILCFENTKTLKKWDNLDLNFVRSVTKITTTLIETQKRKKTEKLLAYKSEILSAITQNTDKILKGKNTRDIFDNVIASIGKVINVDRIYYYEMNETDQILYRRFDWECQNLNQHLDDGSEYETIPLEKLKNLLPYLTKQKLQADLTEKLSAANPLKKMLTERSVKSFLFVAVIIKEKLHGFIGFSDCKTRRIWSEDEISILQTLVDNFGAVIERNINEQIILESEERFRLLANNIPGVVYLSKNDDKWSKIFINDKIEKLTGYSKEDFIENKIFYNDLLHPEDSEYVVKSLRKSLKENKNFNIKYRIKNKSGKIVWIEEYGAAIYKNGEILYIEGVFMDITMKVSQDNAVKEKELAEASNKSKSIFLANMSHEIRTPLNGIIGFTELLKQTSLTEEQQDYLKTIRYSSQMLMVIVNDILDFSKIESGNYKIVDDYFDIRANCEKVLESIRYEALKKNLKISTFIDKKVPNSVLADTIRIKQILINLLSNAIKFTHAGEVSLSVKLKRTLVAGKIRVRFIVSDTGIGIKNENLNKIFEAFSQADNSTTRQFGGTGLGLNISNKILNLLGSKLKLKSVFGVGSVFYFDLHLSEASKTVIGARDVTKSLFDGFKFNEKYADKKWKVLLVEDNKINMLLIKTMIKKLLPLVEIIEAVDGNEGVIAHQKHEPDLILMDIQMPVLNGYEATTKIRTLETGSNRTPIIALTAGIVSDERKKCFEAGMDDFLTKPIMKEVLEFTITKWLDK